MENKTRKWLFVPLEDNRLPWCESEAADTSAMIREMCVTLSPYMPSHVPPHVLNRKDIGREDNGPVARYAVTSATDIIGVLTRVTP